MKNEGLPLLPESLANILKESTNCNITLFGDSGKRYHVVKLYNVSFHKNYDAKKAKNMGLKDYLRPLATLKNSKRILCMDRKEKLYMVFPGIHFDLDTIRNNVTEFTKMVQGEKQTLFLPENKQKHIVAVAEYMYRNSHKYGLVPEEMYVLGLLHDIGYLNGNVGHAAYGGALMEGQNYKYHKEIQYHGKDQDEYESEALWLLNEADLMIDSNGCLVGTKKRLEDIKLRYGEDSKNYIYSKNLVVKMKERGFLNEEN